MNTCWSQLTNDTRKVGWLLFAQSIFINLAMLALPIYTLQLFDRVLVSGSVESLLMLAAGVSVLAIGGVLFEHLRRRTLNGYANHLGDSLTPLVSEAPLETSSSRMQELNRIRQYLKQGSFLPLLDAIWIPITIVVTWFIHPAFGLFVILANLTFVIAATLKQQAVVKGGKESEELGETVSRTTSVNFGAPEWLKANGLEESWRNRVSGQWQNFFAQSNSHDGNHQLAGSLYSAAKWTFQLGLPTIGAILLLRGDVSIGGYLAALIVGTRTMLPIDAMFHSSSAIKEVTAFAAVIKGLTERADSSDAVLEDDIQGRISLCELQPTEKHSLGQATAPVTMEISPSQFVALVGDCGLGAEQVIKVLSGETEFEGDYLIDDIRFQDWHQRSLNQQVAYMSHEHRLPQLPIIELITGMDLVSRKQAIRYAEKTGLNKMMIELDLDYDSPFKPDWYRLAVGRRLAQTISITAALAKNPRVLLLNHPESNLDFTTLNLLVACLKKLHRDGTTIVIATQSKALLTLADVVHQFHGGKLQRSGSVIRSLGAAA